MSPATRAPEARTAMKLEVCGQPAHSTGGRTSGSGVQGAFCALACSTPAFSNPARTSSGENSPVREKNCLPSALNPRARTSFSITGSNSSTTNTRSTDSQNLRSKPSGRGQEAPSLSTLALGNTSFT